VVDNFTAYRDGRSSYYIPLSIGFIVPTICWVLLWFIPESPRWLVNRGEYDKAERALRRLRPKSFDETLIQEELQDMKEAHQVEMELTKSVAFLDIFRGTNLVHFFRSSHLLTCRGEQ
jgi:Sugar (and other) transporter